MLTGQVHCADGLTRVEPQSFTQTEIQMMSHHVTLHE